MENVQVRSESQWFSCFNVLMINVKKVSFIFFSITSTYSITTQEINVCVQKA